jgi:shikimate 5-dehydrogenase
LSATGALLVGSGLIFGVRQIAQLLLFVSVNGFPRFATDCVTSRITSRLWQQQREHGFFVVVGLDQLIHQVTLAATLWFIFR